MVSWRQQRAHSGRRLLGYRLRSVGLDTQSGREAAETGSRTSGSAAAAGLARALPCAAMPDMPGPSVAVPVAAQAVVGRVGIPAGLLSRRRRGLFRLRPALLRLRLARLHRLRL